MVMADWPDDTVPVIEQVVPSVVLRGDDPYLRLLLFDAKSDVRRADLGPAVAWMLLESLVDFLRQVSK